MCRRKSNTSSFNSQSTTAGDSGMQDDDNDDDLDNLLTPMKCSRIELEEEVVRKTYNNTTSIN